MRGFAARIAGRYLLAKKKAFISFITLMAIVGVASGVAVLTTIVGISSGLQSTITRKVVGVNAHVLVMTGGWEFDRYEDAIVLAQSVDGVEGAAPFVINERMILKGSRTQGVLVKGVDPERSAMVLDVDRQVTGAGGIPGSLRDLRPRPGAEERVLRRSRTPGVEGEATRDPVLPGLSVPAGGEGLDTGDDAEPAEAEEGERREPGEAQEAEARAEAIALGEDPAGAAGKPENGVDSPSETPPSRESEPLPPPKPRPRPGSGEELFHADAYRPDLFEEPDQADELSRILDLAVEEAPPQPEAAAALPGLILGRTLAEKLDARVGDVVQIVSPSGGFGFGVGESAPTDVSFEVVGIFYSGFNEYDSRLVYIHLREAQEMFQRGDTVTGIELRLDDLERAGEVAASLRSLLTAYDTVDALRGTRGGFLRVGGSWDRFPSRRWLPRRTAALATLPATLLADSTHQTSYRVITWQDLNKNLFTALWVQKVVLTIVLAVVVGVAAFNIVSTLIMIVLEKKKEIAILKSMGALDRDIRGIFLVVGTVIGSIGLAIGVGLGLGLSALLRAYGWPLDPKVYMIDRLPVDVRASDYLLCAGIAFVICLVATLVPSWRAARMPPVEGLHYE